MILSLFSQLPWCDAEGRTARIWTLDNDHLARIARMVYDHAAESYRAGPRIRTEGPYRHFDPVLFDDIRGELELDGPDDLLDILDRIEGPGPYNDATEMRLTAWLLAQLMTELDLRFASGAKLTTTSLYHDLATIRRILGVREQVA